MNEDSVRRRRFPLTMMMLIRQLCNPLLLVLPASLPACLSSGELHHDSNY